MKLRHLFPLAAEFLRRNRVRAALTALGIVIGISSVVALVSAGTAARASITSQINSLGPNLMFVTPGAPTRRTVGFRPPPVARAGALGTLTLADAEAIKSSIPGLEGVAPELGAAVPVTSAGVKLNATVTGTTADYQAVRNARAREGGFFTARQEELGLNVAVVGSDVAAELGQRGRVGSEIELGNRPFVIVGILEPRGQVGGQSLDGAIFVPARAAKAMLVGDDRVRLISVSVAPGQSESASEEIRGAIGALLRYRHRLAPGAGDDFSMSTQSDLLATAESITGILTVLLGSIAGISLLVGGVGVMNIMLVSVRERTREIGLRKAVGARRRDILLQFVTEAVLLTVAGGVIGIGLGSLGAMAIAGAMDLEGGVSASAVIVAFFVSAAVGLFFGVYPATRAASLEPIQALRYE